MVETYLYDPDPRKRRRARRKRHYDPDPRKRRRRTTPVHVYQYYDPRKRRRRHYDPGIGRETSGILDNITYWLGGALNSYLTTKQSSMDPVLASNISAVVPNGNTWDLYTTEAIGLAGGLAVPFLSRKKWASYVSKFLAGMGAPAIQKMFDPKPDKSNETPEKTKLSEIEKFKKELRGEY